ncbi:hypothetical protein ABTE32_23035, partial [Acinetobacter baumannii]
NKLRELKEQLGLAIVLVEQDIRFVRKLADRVFVLQKGSMVAELAANEIAGPVLTDLLGV